MPWHSEGLPPSQEMVRQGANSLPAVTVAGGTLLGVPLGDVVLWGTLLYVLLQIIVIAPKVPEALSELFSKKEKKCESNSTNESDPS